MQILNFQYSNFLFYLSKSEHFSFLLGLYFSDAKGRKGLGKSLILSNTDIGVSEDSENKNLCSTPPNPHSDSSILVTLFLHFSCIFFIFRYFSLFFSLFYAETCGFGFRR